jgi:hypothetical protein
VRGDSIGSTLLGSTKRSDPSDRRRPILFHVWKTDSRAIVRLARWSGFHHTDEIGSKEG